MPDPLNFVCLNCGHMNGTHVEGVGKCLHQEFGENDGNQCNCPKFASPFLSGGHDMQATATQMTELKRLGATDAHLAKLAVLPNINWTLIIALLTKLATTGVSLADILAALGL